jgi:hypothetical protein
MTRRSRKTRRSCGIWVVFEHQRAIGESFLALEREPSQSTNGGQADPAAFDDDGFDDVAAWWLGRVPPPYIDMMARSAQRRSTNGGWQARVSSSRINSARSRRRRA